MPELERDLAYVAVFAFVLFAARRTAIAPPLVASVVLLCIWSLVRYDPSSLDPVEGRLLLGPIGYANGLGASAAIALPAAFVGLCDPRWVVRAVTNAAVPLFVACLYLTQSRGAAIAAVAGVLVVVAALRHSVGGALAVPGSAAALAVCLLERPLSRPVSVLMLDALLFGVAAASGILGALSPPHGAAQRRLPAWLAPGVAVAALVVPSIAVAASSQQRALFWRVAWRQFLAHPLTGSGPGTFDRFWLADRPVATLSQEAHSLYLETLAELGVVGLALLVAFVALPFVALRSRRLDAQCTALLGAYVTFVVHAGFDWDWELPFVTVLGLAAAAALIAGREPAGRPVRARWPLATAGALAALAAAGSLVGNLAYRDAADAAARGNLVRALERGSAAARWQPWSSQPHLLRGRAYEALAAARPAAAEFGAAIRADPGDWRGWFGLGTATTGGEQRRALAQAKRLDPLAFRSQTK